ncbi:MAG: hypothetical protein GWP09_00525 [Nitrospiraceae bacterium]|nr:hypothetical protein [Nitrospiraceae bacterium]
MATRWSGWLAAVGGGIAFLNYLPSMKSWALIVGASMAIIFGIWAVYEK